MPTPSAAMVHPGLVQHHPEQIRPLESTPVIGLPHRQHLHDHVVDHVAGIIGLTSTVAYRRRSSAHLFHSSSTEPAISLTPEQCRRQPIWVTPGQRISARPSSLGWPRPFPESVPRSRFVSRDDATGRPGYVEVVDASARRPSNGQISWFVFGPVAVVALVASFALVVYEFLVGGCVLFAALIARDSPRVRSTLLAVSLGLLLAVAVYVVIWVAGLALDPPSPSRGSGTSG